MDKKEIENILPHRNSMLLIDSVELKDNVAYGKKTITGSEWFLDGHFPNNPIVPGVVLCEILAQSVCVCLNDVTDKSFTPLFTGLDKVKFKNPVKPGDTFCTQCKITKSRPPFYFAEGKGYVGDKLCVKAEFSFAVIEEKDE